ncbi:hypothetical protein ACSJH2_21855, partial [Klebsiella pneumoniae]
LKTQPATGETYPKSDLFNKASDRLPDEMISEYRVFSGNPFDLLTRRFVPHPFPGSFRYQD